MAYQLWELESRNCVADFASRAEALAAVRRMTREHSDGAAASLLLVREDAAGDIEEIAAGAELARLASTAKDDAST